MKHSSYLIETLVGLAAVALAGQLAGLGMGMVSLELHPYWLIVLLIAVRYGSKEGTLTGAVCALAYTVFSMGEGGEGSGPLSLRSSEFYSSVGFVVAGFVFGEIRSVQAVKARHLEKELARSEQSLEAARNRLEASETAKTMLERRISGQVSTLRTLYDCAKRLESLDAGELLGAIPEIIHSHLRAQFASVYHVERHTLTLLSRSGNAPAQLHSERVNVDDVPLFAKALRERRVVSVRELATRDVPAQFRGGSLMCGPVLGPDTLPVALVTIDRIAFLDLSSSTENMFAMILEWASDAYAKATRFNELEKRSVRNEELGVYRYEYFSEAIARICDRSLRFGIPLTVFLVKIDRIDAIAPQLKERVIRTVALTLVRALRVIDVVAEYDHEGWFAVAVNTNRKEDAGTVKEKLIQNVSAYGITPYGDGRPLSLSVGEAHFDASIRDPRRLLELAESSLLRGTGDSDSGLLRAGTE